MHQEATSAIVTEFPTKSHEMSSQRITIHPSVASSTAHPGLLNRQIDFWLMGGASCLVWFAMTVLTQFREQYPYAINRHFGGIAAFAGMMSLFINYPHFMLSYKIAYGRGWRFVTRNWFQLIFIPAALAVTMIFSYVTFSDPSPLSREWNPTRIAAGEGVFSLLIILMFLTVGWHYVKQTFGCMMVYSSIDGYKLSSKARKVLLGTLYVVWYANLIGAHVGPARRSDFYGLPFYSASLPLELRVLLDATFWVGLGVFAFIGPFKIWKETKKLPSLNFLIPLIALTIWWNPAFINMDFYLVLVPMFHSLQYLPFAAKYEASRTKERRSHWAFSNTAIIFYMILSGWLAFEFVPGLFPTMRGSTGPAEILFFIAAAHVFINVHHYFIDSVIWKFHHPEVQRYLLGRTNY